VDLTTLLQQARQNRALSLAFSLILIAAAVLLRLLTPVTLSYVTFYPAVILATVAGGWMVGLIALSISTLCVFFLIVPLAGSPATNVYSFWNLGAFWLVCLLIIWLTDLLADLLMSTKGKAQRLELLNQKLAEAEERQHNLMRELSHSMKNQYSVILAMARAAGHQSTSVAEFQLSFADRLHSMSRAHDLLTHKEWKSVPMRDLITAEIEAFSQRGGLDVQGDNVWLREHAVVNIGMALHELATNSIKYGAWSTAGGRVSVRWTLTARELHFTWQEEGGPPVKPGEHQGFGSMILEKIVPSALQGTASLQLPPEGLCWTLNLPLACLDMGEDRG
jgi:two-component sensor histidine kinase